MEIKILPKLFALSVLMIPFGAIFKIQNWIGAELFLITGLLSQIIIGLCALYEIKNSGKYNKGEYFLWMIGFFTLSMPIGLIYFLSVRKKILNQQQ